VAVASAGPYASVHLAPDRQPHQHPTTQFLQAGCPSCHPTNSVKALKATVSELLWEVLRAASSYADDELVGELVDARALELGLAAVHHQLGVTAGEQHQPVAPRRVAQHAAAQQHLPRPTSPYWRI